MVITVEATFENGLLKPKQPLALAEGAEVRLTIHAADEVHDPLDAVIGIGEGPPDGADNHDQYLSPPPKPSLPPAEELPPDPDDPLEAVIGICDDGPPISLAQNHDDIIYGHLKRRAAKKS